MSDRTFDQEAITYFIEKIKQSSALDADKLQVKIANQHYELINRSIISVMALDEKEKLQAMMDHLQPLVRQLFPLEGGKGKILATDRLLWWNIAEDGTLRWEEFEGVTGSIRTPKGEQHYVVIARTAEDPRQVLYHEAFHFHYHEGRLSDDECKLLFNDTIKKWGAERYNLDRKCHPEAYWAEESVAYFVDEWCSKCSYKWREGVKASLPKSDGRIHGINDGGNGRQECDDFLRRSSSTQGLDPSFATLVETAEKLRLGDLGFRPRRPGFGLVTGQQGSPPRGKELEGAGLDGVALLSSAFQSGPGSTLPPSPDANAAVRAFDDHVISRQVGAFGYRDGEKRWEGLPESLREQIEAVARLSPDEKKHHLDGLRQTLTRDPHALAGLQEALAQGRSAGRGRHR